MRNELRIFNRERANRELENLKPLSCMLGLCISRLRGVNRKDLLPRRGEATGFLQRNRYEIGFEYAILEFCYSFREVQFYHLLHRPLMTAAPVAGGGLRAHIAPEIHFAENIYAIMHTSSCVFIWSKGTIVNSSSKCILDFVSFNYFLIELLPLMFCFLINN